MPPKIEVTGNPMVVLRLEVAWREEPNQHNKHLALDVHRNDFTILTFYEGTYLRQNEEGNTFVRVANWDGHYWHGDMRWAAFSTYFLPSAQTIWFMSRLLVNNPYENLIIDHARMLSHDLVPRWFYVGNSGIHTLWANEPNGVATLIQASRKEGK